MFETINSEFEFDPKLFDKQSEAFREMIDDWEQFENSPDFYRGNELPHHFRFTQLKEEITKFLNDLPDFTREYTSYSHQRNIYLKIHAPHLYLSNNILFMIILFICYYFLIFIFLLLITLFYLLFCIFLG